MMHYWKQIVWQMAPMGKNSRWMVRRETGGVQWGRIGTVIIYHSSTAACVISVDHRQEERVGDVGTSLLNFGGKVEESVLPSSCFAWIRSQPRQWRWTATVVCLPISSASDFYYLISEKWLPNFPQLATISKGRSHPAGVLKHETI